MDKRSALELIGLLLIMLGVGLVYVPAAVILTGIGFVISAYQPKPSKEQTA